MNTTRIARVRETLAALLPGTTVRTARNTYVTLVQQAIAAYYELDHTGAARPFSRALILDRIASIESKMADVYLTGWNTHPRDRIIADETTASAQILLLLASTERTEPLGDRLHGPDDWENAFGTVLNDLTGQVDIRRRAELTSRLYTAAYDLLGGDVAETIWRVHLAYIRAAVNSAATAADNTTAAAS